MPSLTKFEMAVDAIASGEAAVLESLLFDNPDLVHARSTRPHSATLLHYVSANGVENFRQMTPQNAVEVATILLKAGAEVDATANTYGGGNNQTTMNLLVSSCHPAKAGVQAALVDTLLDFGASINGLENDGSPLITALAFHYKDAAETLARRGARIDNILTASGLGIEELVRSFVSGDGKLNPDVPLCTVSWIGVATEPKAHVELALIWSAAHGRIEVTDYLSRAGVDLGTKDNQGMTALHWASWHGRMDVLDLLLARGAPREVKNGYGGTVLDSTVYASVNGGLNVDYVPIIERLIAAGARIESVEYPSGNTRVDEVLRRHGAKGDKK